VGWGCGVAARGVRFGVSRSWDRATSKAVRWPPGGFIDRVWRAADGEGVSFNRFVVDAVRQRLGDVRLESSGDGTVMVRLVVCEHHLAPEVFCVVCDGGG
jgi:hypothetical protein